MEVPNTPGKVIGYMVGVAWAWVGVPILTLATAEEIYTKFGMEVPHTPGKVLGYVVTVAGGRVMGVGGRANIDPGNRVRDLDEFFHRGSQHPRQGYRLYGGRVMGVSGRGNINPGNR